MLPSRTASPDLPRSRANTARVALERRPVALVVEIHGHLRHGLELVHP